MQFEALKVFCDIARCRSFSQAAAANGLTQSAASHIVHQLEERLGTQLIDRSTRPLQLTATGQAYYDGCRGLVEQYLELEASIIRSRVPLAATVEVAAIYSVGLGDMGRYVERFQARQPHVRVHVEYLHPDRVHEKVHEGSADLGMVSFPRKSKELAVQPWREEEMVLACPPSHALARCRSVKVARLAGEKYVAFAKGLVIRREVDRFLRDHGVAADVVAEFDNIENIKKGIAVLAGVALLPEPTLRQEVQAGTLTARPLDGCRFVRPLGIIYRRQHQLSAAASRFLDLLRDAGAAGPSTGEANGHAPDPRTGTNGRGASPRPVGRGPCFQKEELR